MKIYQVGGSLRDELLGLKSKDLDYAVEASSYREMRDYIASRGRIYLEKPEYLTIRAQVPDLGDADFVLCRKDGAYSDGRRPDEVQMGTIYDDLARRDFTMNAIARDVQTGELLDPHGGRKDIEASTIACVGRTLDRFREDSLRMLRAVRFSITKGFGLDLQIQECLNDSRVVSLLVNVSKERIREELEKCFAHDTPGTLRALERYGVLRVMIFEAAPGLRLIPSFKE